MAKDKAPEYNTEWTDDMFQRFLINSQRDGDHNDPDFDTAIYAFRFVPAWEFARYAQLFVQAGKNPNAKNAQGKSILQYFKQFPRAGAYVEAWQAITADD